MRDEPVKNAEQDVAEDVTQDVAEDVLGAAEEEALKLHRGTYHFPPPHAFFGRQMKDEHVKDAAQGVAEGVAGDVPQDVAQELTSGARAARALLASRPPPPPPSLRSSC